MSYKLLNFSSHILRVNDGAFIPKDPSNVDYMNYLKWCEAGNTPLPADPLPNPRIAQIKAELAALDTRRIRPLAEGDTAYLDGLNAQAIALRAELQSLTQN
jgi:hypothetical protein